MRIDVITIFPDYLAPLSESLIGKAAAGGPLTIAVHNLRDWTHDRHHSVDDTPYGGGPGMVMRPDVWGRALDDVTGLPYEPGGGPAGGEVAATEHDRGAAHDGKDAPVTGPVLVIPTPSGRPFTQAVAQSLAAADHLVFACGRYEGIDGRVAIDAARRMPVAELSIGDYVLAGGEVAALVIIEAVARLLPGVLGNSESARDDSFAADLTGLVEGLVYTRPAEFRGLTVPDSLRSGHHALIARARRDESIRRTAAMRPDLLARVDADDCDEADFEILTQLGAPVPAGLAERVAASRAERDRRRRRHHRAAP